MTASQVSARVNSARIPATASQASRPAEVRNPIRSATSTMITSVIPLATSEVSTCAHSTDDRAIGMEWNRSKMPLCRSSEQPEGGVRDARGDRDQQDAGQQVVDVVVGAGLDRAAEHVHEQQHQRDRGDRGGDDRVGAADDVAQRAPGQDGRVGEEVLGHRSAPSVSECRVVRCVAVRCRRRVRGRCLRGSAASRRTRPSPAGGAA